MNKESIQLHVNGVRHEIEIPPSKTLLEALREDLRLTGTKCGCDDSSCGCCTVLVDGVPMLSCVMLAVSYQDASITTIEGSRSGRAARPAPGRVLRRGRSPVRLLHPGDYSDRQSAARPKTRNRPGKKLRKPFPATFAAALATPRFMLRLSTRLRNCRRRR